MILLKKLILFLMALLLLGVISVCGTIGWEIYQGHTEQDIKDRERDR